MSLRHRPLWLLVLPAVAAILLAPVTAAAAERTLWQRSASYPLKEKPAQAARWQGASRTMARACAAKTDTRKAVGRVRLPGAFQTSIGFVYRNWPAGRRPGAFDDSCAIARSLRAVGNAIANVAGFCGGFIRCPKAFTVYDRETRQATSRGPDICRWSISLWVTGPPAAVISSPC
jgi:hypothetical protein